MRMRVGKAHLNFNGKCHGGAIFTLADSAFGIAANQYGVIAAGIDARRRKDAAIVVEAGLRTIGVDRTASCQQHLAGAVRTRRERLLACGKSNGFVQQPRRDHGESARIVRS